MMVYIPDDGIALKRKLIA